MSIDVDTLADVVLERNKLKIDDYVNGNKGLLIAFTTELVNLSFNKVEPDVAMAALKRKLVDIAPNHAIKSVTFRRDFVPFVAGESFALKPGINFLCGDQGCGKSTLLTILMNCKEIKIKLLDSVAKQMRAAGKFVNKDNEYTHAEEYHEVVNVDGDLSIPQVFFDTERHNPRIMEGDIDSRTGLALLTKFAEFFAEKKPDIMSDMGQALSAFKQNMQLIDGDQVIYSKFKSHGQVIFPMLKQLAEAKNSIIFLDEPETSLSIRSQHDIARMITQCATERHCQLIIATHSPIIMRSAKEVLSLEHKKWMPTEEFIETQMKPSTNINP